jgi:hypothetical protein
MHEFLCEELSKKDSWRDYPHIENAILKCEELMKLEKEQIVASFVEGMRCQNFHPNSGSAELYYNSTYNTTDK